MQKEQWQKDETNTSASKKDKQEFHDVYKRLVPGIDSYVLLLVVNWYFNSKIHFQNSTEFKGLYPSEFNLLHWIDSKISESTTLSDDQLKLPKTSIKN